jgi:tRNA(fMet)-specific endonuclease VapC
MSGRFLLDTNIVIAIINGEPTVASHLVGSIAFVSLWVVGELEYGARNSSRVTENLDRVRQFVSGTTILVPDLDTSAWYGKVKHALRLKGRPVPENDIWIAAQALQHDLTLVSRDAHFMEIDALLRDTW